MTIEPPTPQLLAPQSTWDPDAAARQADLHAQYVQGIEDAVLADTTVYGRTAAAQLGAGSARIEAVSADDPTAPYTAVWDPTERTVVFRAPRSLTLGNETLLADAIEYDSERVREILALDECARPRDAVGTQFWAGGVRDREARDILQRTETGRQVISWAEANADRISEQDPDKKTLSGILLGYSAESSRVSTNESRLDVQPSTVWSPHSDARLLAYAYALDRSGGDRARAEDEFLQIMIGAGLEPSAEQLLDEALALLEQTPATADIAKALRANRDRIKIQSGQEARNGLLGEGVAGQYHPFTGQLTMTRTAGTSLEDFASTLAHEGQHLVDFQRGLPSVGRDIVTDAIGGLITAPLRWENPLTAAMEGGWDEGLQTERRAYRIQDTFTQQLGSRSSTQSDDEIESHLDSSGHYRMSEPARIAGGIGIGVGLSLGLTGIAAAAARYAHTPRMGWTPLKWGLLATSALMGYDALNRHVINK